MGGDSFVLVIGEFKRSVAACLDYPQEFYQGTREGALVTSRLFQCVSTQQSRELAAALGCELYDFNTHCFDASKANDAQLSDLAAQLADGPLDLVHFMKLRGAGFSFIFQPNG